MITKFNMFENERKPDLRQMSEYVKCIKDITSPYFKIRNKKEIYIFKKGKIYKVSGIWGDPEKAIEKYGINDYTPVECISDVEIYGDDGQQHFFAVSQFEGRHTLHPHFFDYFEVMEESSSAKNYNL